jgi:hypothetical protein
MRTLFLRAKLLNALLDNFVNYSGFVNLNPTLVVDTKSPEYLSKLSSRGIIMNCCNAIRLQAMAMPPSDFLREYLSTVDRWNEFLPQLRLATEFQQEHAMGLTVSDVRTGPTQHLAALSLSSDPKPDSEIDHGSRLAKALGFIDEVAWPIESNANTTHLKRDNYDDTFGGTKKNKLVEFDKISNAEPECINKSENQSDVIDGVPEKFNDLAISEN